jgi:hypothetical protein
MLRISDDGDLQARVARVTSAALESWPLRSSVVSSAAKPRCRRAVDL